MRNRALADRSRATIPRPPTKATLPIVDETIIKINTDDESFRKADDLVQFAPPYRAARSVSCTPQIRRGVGISDDDFSVI
jgi:hypothetical protein